MNKSPSFQFYAQDFLTGVVYLTNEEIGIYIKMLAKQWTDEKIPKKRLGLFVGLEWDMFSEELKSKFEEKGDYVINSRLEIEREKKLIFLDKQAINGKKGGRPRLNKPKLNPNKTQIKPLEEEDEIEVEEEYDNILIKRKEKSKLIELYGFNGYRFMIHKLSNYKLSTGKKYKSDYGAINSWVVKEWKKEKRFDKKEKTAYEVIQDIKHGR